MKTMELPPYAPTLMESTRAIGYSLEAAVADIIDNSIAAEASRVDISFFPIDESYIAILDNGMGMNADELNKAMQYGSKNPEEVRDSKDLGRFGLGLKTASLSQCRILTVVTKQGDCIEARRWDIDLVAQTKNWSLVILEDSELKGLPQIQDLLQLSTGTLVIWQNLDRLKMGEINFEQSLGRKIDNVREHLALVYHRYLFGESDLKKLAIVINGKQVVPTDPFLIKKSTKVMDDEVLLVEDEKIVIRPYMLPHISKMTAEEIKVLGGKDGLRRQQGFYIYRNKRLLVWGTWFRMMRQGEMSKLVRICVDIPNSLDNLWTLDIKKSSAIPPVAVRDNLKILIEKMAETSKRTWTFRGKKETDDSVSHVWNRLKTRMGGYMYEINRDYPLFVELVEDFPEMQKRLILLIQRIENGIPLNSLYMDLTNDVKIENEKSVCQKEVLKMVKDILSTTESSLHESMIETLVHSEPFDDFYIEIKEAFRKGELT